MDKLTTNSLGYLLERALWAMSNSLNVALKEQGIDLPHSQYIIMRVLFEHDGLSQNEIATHLLKDASAIKRSVDYLEKKDFVQRKSVSGCKYGIYLTDNGKKLKSKVVAIADDIFKKSLSNISDETYQTGIKFLEDIYKSCIMKE